MTQDRQHLDPNGITRRSFLKFCSAVAAAIGLGPAAAREVAAALTSPTRPPVLWLHFAECTGCTEAILRTIDPWFDELILDSLSLDYHETLMAGAGAPVHKRLFDSARQYAGSFFCVVEGSIPTAQNGVYGMIGGKTMLSIAQEIIPQAKAVICSGSCASYGGLAAASPNPTGAKGVTSALPNLKVPVINVPGCPPNPVNLVGVITDYLLNGTLPALDSKGRPRFAYGQRVHEQCPFRTDRNRCLKPQGCKGPQSYNNCPTIMFNDGTSFPMKSGHPCIGCCEPGHWDTMTPFYTGYPV